MERGFTRVSTIGPIVDMIVDGGGSVDRVFRKAELPVRLSEDPDGLIMLRDQFNLLDLATAELGASDLPARLALSAGLEGLGDYGRLFLLGPTLGVAIQRGSHILDTRLQTATAMTMTVRDGFVHWTYAVTGRVDRGRQLNEVLAIGYMLAAVRRFAGSGWTPTAATLPGASGGHRASENLYRCAFRPAERAGLVFPADLLDLRRSQGPDEKPVAVGRTLPGSDEDLPDLVRELVRLALLGGRPNRAWVARHLGLSVRTLQRRLDEHGTSFARVLREACMAQAADVLRRGGSVSDAAFSVGFSDPAHFARAFRDWFGQSPRAWRRTA